LAVLYARVTALTEQDVAPSKDERDEEAARAARKKERQGGSASANGDDEAQTQPLHHTDPAHKHNRSATERRRRAEELAE
jgi:hypothetical protein